MIHPVRISFFTGFLFFATLLSGQEHRHTADELFKTAVELYKQEQYWSAYELFSQIRSDDAGSSRASLLASYRILCEIGMKDPAIAERVARWELDYPSAPMKHQIYFKMGELFSARERYKEAMSAYDKVHVKKLPVADRSAFSFRKGYASLQTGDSAKAALYFEETEKFPGGTSYKWASRYYRGYIHYSEGRFDLAVPLLEPLTDVPQYGALSSVYLLQALFYLKQYERVIQQGVPIYRDADPALRTTLAKTLSEAYFALDRTQEARDFFDDYMDDVSALTLTDRYFSGILYFKLGDFIRAAEQLSIVGERQDSLGQNALYHLGESYIRLRNKVDAMEAFKRASSMDFDPAIREDAFFNYAKLSFDLNRDIQVLSLYRKEYENSPKLDEIQSYIAANYFINQDYASAVQALQALRTPTPENLADLKKAAYLRGIQLYQAGSFRDAEKYFGMAEEPYWVAECLYRSNMFSNAINLWKQYIQRSGSFSNPDKYRTSHYNIAYAYFKTGDYTTAADWFHRYPAGQNRPCTGCGHLSQAG